MKSGSVPLIIKPLKDKILNFKTNMLLPLSSLFPSDIRIVIYVQFSPTLTQVPSV